MRFNLNLKKKLKASTISRIVLYDKSFHKAVLTVNRNKEEYKIAVGNEEFKASTLESLLGHLDRFFGAGYRVYSIHLNTDFTFPEEFREVERALPHPTEKKWCLLDRKDSLIYWIPDDQIYRIMYSGIKLEGLEVIL